MLYYNDSNEARLESHAASLGGHALDGCGEFMPSPADDPASLRYAAVPQVERDSRALHGEEMLEDRSRPPSTARLRHQISATIFYLFCFKNKYPISIYVYSFVYTSITNLYINLYCQMETSK